MFRELMNESAGITDDEPLQYAFVRVGPVCIYFFLLFNVYSSIKTSPSDNF